MLAGPVKEEIYELAKKVWENPELSGEEYFACREQLSFLREKGFTVFSPIAGEKTAYKAVFTHDPEPGKELPAFAFCAEYDALPNVKHGCGHHLIMGCAITASLALKELLQRENLPGKIVLYGCPAEETYGGKCRIAAAGLEEEIHGSLMAHPVSGTRAMGDVCYAGARSLRFIYSGTGGSPVARMINPAFTNPLDAQLLLYQALSMRKHFFPNDVTAVGVISEGGERSNVLPIKAESSYTVRSQDPRHLEEYTKILETMAEGAAKMTGTSLEIQHGNGLEPTKPNLPLNKAFLEAMEKRGYEGNHTLPVRGGCFASTDFGAFASRFPSCHLHFPIMAQAAPHTEGFHILSGEKAAYESMFAAGESMAETALRFLRDAPFRQEVRENFAKEDIFA